MERGLLLLDAVLMAVAEHLGSGRLIELRPGCKVSNCLKQSKHSDRVDVGGQHRLIPKGADEGLSPEIIHLIPPSLLQAEDP